MRTHIVGLLIVGWFLHGRCGYGQTDVAQTIIAMERAALDRWRKGDPQGFFEIMASDQTYFDPVTEKRLDGQSDLKQYMAPFTGKIRIERVEMIDPKVQTSGDIAVLTFNLNDYGAQLGDGPKAATRVRARKEGGNALHARGLHGDPDRSRDEAAGDCKRKIHSCLPERTGRPVAGGSRYQQPGCRSFPGQAVTMSPGNERTPDNFS